MLKRWTWLAMLLIAMAAFWGCSDDDDPVVPQETAFDVMSAAGEAYINDSADCPGTISAAVLEAALDDYTVIDIRGAADYRAGHIPGAVNVALADIDDYVSAKALPMDEPIVVACYTGQSAGHAKIALELLGYEDTKTLAWGMSSWSPDVTGGKWSDEKTNDALTAPETTNNNADLVDYDFPTLSESKSTVVTDRVAAMLNAGFKVKSYADVAAAPDDYFVINYFGEADYLGTGTAGVPGHIPGSYQFTPYASLGVDEMLGKLPTDMPIVVYCWTGQHSSQVTAYLNMLGYDAYSLAYGSNNLFHSDLLSNNWVAGNVNNFDLEVGDDLFEYIVDEATDYINDSTDCPGTISSTELEAALDDYIVLDVRQPDAYEWSHIPGAINVTWTNIFDVMETEGVEQDDYIAVACYTGQSAGHYKAALEMLGYENVRTLAWGMSSWNADVLGSKWSAGSYCEDAALGTTETTNNNGDLVTNAFPELDGGSTLEGLVKATLAEGFKAKGYSTIESVLEDYFIVNYFAEGDYDGTSALTPGHLPGAYQFTPYTSLGFDQMLENLPSDGTPILVYCWTGQHSSQVTFYLNVLGYNAFSLSKGSNGLFYSQLGGHKWDDANVKDFDMEGTFDDPPK